MADPGSPDTTIGGDSDPADTPGTPQSAGLRGDMEVLRELASDECLRRDGLGVVRIAERLGREKSQVSRALRALEAEGLVERDPPTRISQLGWGLYTLAARGVETRPSRLRAGRCWHWTGRRGRFRDLIPSDTSDQDNLLAYHDLLASSARAREHGYAQHPGAADQPARFAAAVRDFRGIVLAAIQLAERPGSRPALNGIPAGQAVMVTADALSTDLGYEG